MPRTQYEEQDPIARDYAELKADVNGLLYAKFGNAIDRDEVYNEAWEQLLAARKRGEQIRTTRGFLRTIAYRRGRDRFRASKRSTPVAPDSPALYAKARENVLSPADQAQRNLDLAMAQEIVDALEPRQAMVFKLRYEEDLERRDIRKRLGMSRPTLDHLLARARLTIDETLAAAANGEPEKERRQRSLLLLCLLGNATDEQLERARHMLSHDVRCRAMLAELRAMLDNTAALIPMPVLLEEYEQQRGLPLLDRLHDGLASAKTHAADLASRWTGRGPTGEQAAAGGAAALGAGATKLALGCIAAGTAAVCLTPALFPSTTPNDAHREPPARTKPVKRVPREPRPVRLAVVTPKPKPTPAPKRRQASTKQKTPSPTGPAAPSPAPPGATEFGPGNVGSQPASHVPAAAPTTGGGEFTP